MGVDKYKFVSPGVFVKEVDESQLPADAVGIGPVVVGRFTQGPAFRPTRVESFDQLTEIFGKPVPGGAGGDVWRDGNHMAPTYAGYAAQAYLRNNGPITVVRVLGVEDPNADKSTQAKGGANWRVPVLGTHTSVNGGAYGLFMADSGSSGLATGVTGTLAAVWYLENGEIALSGNHIEDTHQTATSSNATLLLGSAQHEFKVVITPHGEDSTTHTFNFNPSSDKFIRKVFNTNPALTNTATNASGKTKSYWLGETFERAVNEKCTGEVQVGVVVGLGNTAGSNSLMYGDRLNIAARPSETGYFFSQNLSFGSGSGYTHGAMDDLFKVVSLDNNGEWNQRNLKISITDIKQSPDENVDPYGTFTLEVRKIDDLDHKKVVLESFERLTLNPNSPNYAAAIIGDRYITYDSTERRYKEYNDYPNNSKYIRLEMHENVKSGLVDERALPFGVRGPLKFKSWQINGTTTPTDDDNVTGADLSASYITLDNIAAHNAENDPAFVSASLEAAADIVDLMFEFPSMTLRSSSLSPEGFANEKRAYFGVDLRRKNSTSRFDKTNIDLVRALPTDVSSFTAGTYTDHQFQFTLDDIRHNYDNDVDPSGKHGFYESGSCASGLSITAISGGYTSILDKGLNKFTTVLHGGSDGLDVTEAEPFRNTILDGTDSGYGSTANTNYAFASLKRAMEVISEADQLDFNLAVMPGITNETLTKDLVDLCEERGDALAIIDLKGGYQPIAEGAPNSDPSSGYPKNGSVSSVISNIKARDLNSSYGCAYYPWVQVRDSSTAQLLWVPPSVAALGTLGSSATKSELWFAPAGFNRGGLSEGSAGLNVVSVRDKVTAEQRDDLYENRVNPIASFASEGIVVFGQKTLQIGRSALDRINVRRLMIFLKKEISRIANRILFDQNVPTTWARFTSQAVPLLESVKTRLGLEDYKLILDESTTTPDLRDRNVMYAKVLLKPARAIEYIAIDFTIMNSGAAFDD